MPNPYTKANGRGSRGTNNADRPSRIKAAIGMEMLEDRSKGKSTTALLPDHGIFCKDNDLHSEGRESITVSQHLGLFSPEVETVDLIKRQLVTNPTTGEITVVTTTDPFVIWKSDRTLLRPNPFKGQEDNIGDFKRETSRSKRIKYEDGDTDASDFLLPMLRLMFRGRTFRLVSL